MSVSIRLGRSLVGPTTLPRDAAWLVAVAVFNVALLSATATAAEPTGAGVAAAIQFNRDIRPLLSDQCFQCHGPDKNQRKADLRLDQEETTIGTAQQPGAVVRGKPDDSELMRRLTATDPAERMPPPETGRKLSAEQIDLIRRWIAQGAPWQKHWAFLPIERPPVPSTQAIVLPNGVHSSRSPLDAFVRNRLTRENLRPSEEAPRETLIRRVTLDLTGLPPTPEEVDDFVADARPDAYERLVDRLLASPRWGERIATRWLDAARYADTSGYQNDGPRYMWRWRDWVIDALNHDTPFDQFTVEQLAGDLLPNATLEQKIATGFNRNHRGNAEGGIIPEEYAVEYVIDRVETTSTVWLGLTMGCGRCHEHKFDPISQRDFYQLFAYFNNVPEFGRAIKEGNSPPYIKAPTVFQREELARLTAATATAARRVEQLAPRVAEAQRDWEPMARRADPATPPVAEPRWSLTDGLVARFALDDPATAADSAATSFVPGRFERAADIPHSNPIAAGDIAGFGYTDPFSLSAWILTQGEAGGTIVSKMTDVPQGDGYGFQIANGKLQFFLVKRWLDDALRVETRDALTSGQWHHVLVSYDGSRVASGVSIYVDGQRRPLTVQLDALNQTITTKEPLRIGAGGGPAAHFQGLIDEVRVYERALSADDVAILASAESIPEILATSPDRRTAGAARKLRAYFVERHAPAEIRAAFEALVRAQRDQAKFEDSIPTVMVMEEMPTPRPSFVLKRGEYDKPGDPVQPSVPDSFGRLPQGAPNNRLGLAQWLVDPSNPLTARVAVNRLWQMLFGAGLVKTTEDFGSQGEPPSHPELLDWLASEFRAPGAPNAGTAIDRANLTALSGPLAWSVKHLVRELVTSGTYRQSSRATEALLQRDPDNRLLARGPRFRLSAEVIRDQALAASGLLVEQLGGPSVKPYQPADLWKELATDSNYVQDHGAALYRRSMYTYWKRTVAPPTMVTFDASGREACSVRDTRTNTPLQALTLLNEVTFVEAARALAQRVLREAEPSVEGRIIRAFRLAAGRAPRPTELALLRSGLAAHLQRYRADRAAAEEVTKVGEWPVETSVDVAELAAYTAVASVILNLDEVLNKP